MKWLKIAEWLVFTLIAMRLVSWALCWIVIKLLRLDVRMAAILANLTAFVLYLLLLHRQLEPGEPIDGAAVMFGAGVFFVYLGIDFFWVPWKAGRPRAAKVDSGQKKA